MYIGEDVVTLLSILRDVLFVFHDEDHIESGEEGDGEPGVAL
jgi:hypothetical protein